MNRRDAVLVLLTLSVSPRLAVAQQRGKVWRIGMLETTSKVFNASNFDAFLKGMQELGYVEGRNFVIDYRSAEGRAERFPALASELVRGKVDLIVTRGTPATEAAKKVAGTTPVVSAALGEPLLFVASLAEAGREHHRAEFRYNRFIG